MDDKLAVIEGVYDLFLSGVPTSLHRWGRVVWLHDIEVGLKGQLIFVKDGKLRRTNLSCISIIIQTEDYLEVHTQSSLYKFRYL